MCRPEQTSHVVTLDLDFDSFAWLNSLRQQHFPAPLNYLDAHLTLFHTVDDQGYKAISLALANLRLQPIGLTFCGLRNLGRGVAV